MVEIGPKGMLAKQHVCGFKSRRPVYTKLNDEKTEEEKREQEDTS